MSAPLPCPARCDDPQPAPSYSPRRPAPARHHLDAISDVLDVDDGSFVWVGLYEPDDAAARQDAGGVRPARPRRRGRAQRAPAAEDRGLRRLAVPRRCTPRRWSTATSRFGETQLFFGPRYLVTVRHGASMPLRAGARALRARAGAAAHRPELRRCTRCSTPSSTTSCRSSRSSSEELNELEQDIFAETSARDTVQQPLRAQARADPPAAGGVAAAGHPRPADALAPALVDEEMPAVLPRRATTTSCASTRPSTPCARC